MSIRSGSMTVREMSQVDRQLWQNDVTDHSRRRNVRVVLGALQEQERVEYDEAWSELLGDSESGGQKGGCWASGF